MTISTASQIDAYQAKLKKLAGQIRDRREPNRLVSVEFYKVTIRNFDAEGAMYGKWAPLKESTIKRKDRLGKERMLVITGHLRSGFVPFYDGKNAGVRNEVEYAAAHHFGNPDTNLPKRNLLPTRQAANDIGLKVYNWYIGKIAREAN